MNWKKLILLACALPMLPLFGAPRTLWPQEASANVRWRLEGGAGIRNGCMRFENAKADGYSSATLWFPARPGELYTFRAKIKGKNIGEKQHPMHGVVFSLFTQEGDKWNSLGKPVPLKGSFDWTEIRFTARIPEYLPDNSGNLIVGLHYATGTLLVKDVTVEKELELKFDEKIPEHIRRMRQIDLGFLALDRYGFHPYRLQKNLNRWYTLRSKLADMPERRRTHELDAMEQFLLGLSSQVLGTILSPNYLPDWEPDRLKKTRAEQEARYADWRIGAEVLTQAGLPCSVEDEIARIEAVRKQFPDGTVVTFSDIDRAAELYKKIAEERLRLGSELLSLRRELKAWTSAKILHPENAEPPLGQLSPRLSRWESAYRSGNYPEAAAIARECEATMQQFRQQSAESAALQPGASLRSCGVFGFSGNWHTLLTTNARDTSMWIDSNNEFQLYKNKNFDWEVSFRPEGFIPVDFKLQDGSWTYSRRTVRLKNLQSGKYGFMDVYWSSLAPGLLFQTDESSMNISDLTLKSPQAPAAFAAVVNGQVKLFRQNETLPGKELTENWILLLWENSAPKIPVLVTFGKLPDAIVWGRTGLVVRNQGGIGSFSAAPLHGASVQPADYGKMWRALPEKELEQCRRMAAVLNYFPLDLEEFFQILPGKVRIVNRIAKAIRLLPDAKPYVPMVPAYTLAMPDLLDFHPDKELSTPLCTTKFGFFRIVPGESFSFELPLPDMLDRVVLKPSGEEKMISEVNRFILSERSLEFRTCSALDWYAGLFSGINLMTPESKKFLDLLPLTGQRDRVDNAEEVFGRCHSSPWFLSPDLLIDPSTGRAGWCAGWRAFRHGFPMKGDMTCFNMQLLQTPYAEAVYQGRWDRVETHWPRIREFFSGIELCQIWQVPGMNTTTSGLIIAGDMYGDGFRSFYHMYHMASGMKDRALAERARYLAARQNATTAALINRNVPPFAAHLHNVGDSVQAEGHLGWLIGVDNHGLRAANWKNSRRQAPFQNAGCLTYDNPFFETLLCTLPAESREWIRDFRTNVPDWSELETILAFENEGGIANAWNTLKFLAFTTSDREAVRKIMRKFLRVDFRASAPPHSGLETLWKKVAALLRCSNYPMGINAIPHVIAQNDPIWLGGWGRSLIIGGTYDRERRIAEISLLCPEPETIRIVSRIRPIRILRNGMSVEIQREEAHQPVYKVNADAGAVRIRVELPPYAETDCEWPESGKLAPVLKLPVAPAPGEFRPESLQLRNFAPGKCTPLRLEALCNQPGNDQEPDKQPGDVWKIPSGEVMLRGVPFSLVKPSEAKGYSMIMLKGKARPQYPERVLIPVNRQCKRIYFLHGLCYPEGGKALTYRLHFEDGQTRDIEVYDRVQISSWKVSPNADMLYDLPHALAVPAWPAGRPGQWGKGVGGYIFACDNDVTASGVTLSGMDQRGLARLKSIEVISAGRSVPILLAITLED